MLVGWIDLIRRPLTQRNDFVSVDARRAHSDHSPKNYEMITSPPTTSGTPKTSNPVVVTTTHSDHEGLSPLAQSPPSPSSQYTNDYYPNNKEIDPNNYNHNNKSPQLSFSLKQEADYKSPKLSFSTPRPPSAGRSFSRDSGGRSYQPMMMGGGTTRPLSPLPTTTRRESGGSTFSSAYDWDPAATYAPSGTTHVQSSSYGRSDLYRL